MSLNAITWARKQTVGKAGAKFVLFILADYAGADGGSCFPKIASIAKDTEQDERTVRRHLDYLEKEGFIARERQRHRDGSYGRYTYQILLDKKSKTELEEPADKMSAGQDNHRTICPIPPVKMSGLYEPSIQPPLKNKKTDFENLVFGELGESSEIKDQINACWDYWQAYPEKKPKGDLLSAFRGWMRFASPRQGLSGGKTKKRSKHTWRSKQDSSGASMGQMDKQRIKGFLENGFWLSQWGPKPGEDRCQIPVEIINEVKQNMENVA